jgi:hypothetical protein
LKQPQFLSLSQPGDVSGDVDRGRISGLDEGDVAELEELFRFELYFWSVLFVVAAWKRVVSAFPMSSFPKTILIAVVPEVSKSFRVVVESWHSGEGGLRAPL